MVATFFATLPALGRAATITFSYDPQDMEVTGDGGSTFLPAAFNASTNTVTVPAGDILEIGVDVTVTNNPNPAAAGTTGAATYNASNHNQPATLGLAAYGFGLVDSNATVAKILDANPPNGQTTSTAGTGDATWDTHIPGNVEDVQGGINFNTGPEAGYLIASSHNSKGTLAVNTGLFGVGTNGPAELLDSLDIQTSAVGTAVFTPSDQVATGNLGLTQYQSGGSSNFSAPVYTNYTVQEGDGNTVNNLPALTLLAIQNRIPGDANGDGKVDVTDLGVLATHFGLNSGATWAQGDFNGDGKVNVSDLGLLATYYGESLAGVVPTETFSQALAQIDAQDPAFAADLAGTSFAVPEPSALSLLGMGGIALLRCRRKV